MILHILLLLCSISQGTIITIISVCKHDFTHSIALMFHLARYNNYTVAYFNRQVESCVNLIKIDLSYYKYPQD